MQCGIGFLAALLAQLHFEHFELYLRLLLLLAQLLSLVGIAGDRQFEVVLLALQAQLVESGCLFGFGDGVFDFESLLGFLQQREFPSQLLLAQAELGLQLLTLGMEFAQLVFELFFVNFVFDGQLFETLLQR